MGRIAVVVIALAACGRIGFDDVRVHIEAGATSEAGVSHGIDAGAGDAPLVTGDGSVTGCHYVMCPSFDVACCVNGTTSCIPAATTCTGEQFDCGSCPVAGQICCPKGITGGTICRPGPICPG